MAPTTPEMPPGRAPGAEGPSPLEQALVSLIAASTHLAPDDLGRAVRTAGDLLGGWGTTVLLVDLGQRVLHPLDAGDGVPADAQLVDGTPAGQAFRTEAVVEQALPEGVRLWVPILDSAERLGVVSTVLDAVTPAGHRPWALLASLVGEVIVAKERYGDHLATARRDRPVSLAAEMRWAQLPPLTYTSPRLVVSGILEPAYEIAGDTFDYGVGRSSVRFGLFDAMGHGLEAGRMANLAVGVHRHSRRHGADLPASALAIDEVLAAAFGNYRFVTAQLGLLDLESGLMQTTNAGHPPPAAFHRDGSWEELPSPPSLPLGLGTQPRVLRHQLQEGDVVLFHTDGVTEARSASGDHLGPARLHRIVADLLAARLRPAEVLRQVVAAVRAHEGGDPRDDATLLLVGWQMGDGALPPATRDQVGPV